MSNQIILWLRAETKDSERRTPLTPQGARSLIEKGASIFVERARERIFPDEDYQAVGCELTDPGSWKNAPSHAFILGLKELPEDDFALKHGHIYFAHVYKGQDGAAELLSRFKQGKGELYDLEYMTDENQRRVAAFGHWAGFVGAAIAVDSYYFHLLNPGTPYPHLTCFLQQEDLIKHIENKKQKLDKHPKAMVIGAKGRCGKGCIELLNILKLNYTAWDYEETKGGGPFKEITDHHIFVNAALIQKKIPPFLDQSVISGGQALKIIADVSCDPYGDLNPIPLYNRSTTWDDPLLVYNENGVKMDILAVDNLPSLLPKESSQDFSAQLLPHLESLVENGGAVTTPWKNSLEVFKEFLQ